MPRPSPNPLTRSTPALAAKVAPRLFPLPPPPANSPVKAQLDRILTSRTFSGAHRSQLFLRYILHHALAHPDEPLKEYSIAVDVFDRDASYDPAVNNTVRVEAGRLRSRLREYYADEGRADSLLIEVPKGSYRVLIHHRDSDREPEPASTSLLLPTAKPPRPLASVRIRHLWAVPLAFLVGIIIGHRASH